MHSVACLGECMIELVERRDGTLTRGFGGDTLNTAVYLARLGVPTAYVTALGTDPFSEDMLQAWRAEGIDTAHVARVPGKLPGLYLIRVSDKGERSFFHWRDSAPVRRLFALPEAAAVEAALEAAELVYLSGITLSLFDEAARERLFGVLAAVRRRGGRVAFDTNFRPRGWPDLAKARAVYERMYRAADIVLAGVEDDLLLHGAADAAQLLHQLHTAGVAEIVVKLEHPACRVVDVNGDVLVPAPPVAGVVDTTAAGDSFAAGYLAARRAGRPAIEAAQAGHQLAGTVVRYRGAIIPRDAMPAPPSSAEVP